MLMLNEIVRKIKVRRLKNENSQNIHQTKELINKILKENYELSGSVARTRIYMVISIQTYLEFIGFPKTQAVKRRLSLVPLLFQEANYDNIDFCNRAACLEQLADFFELDCMFQNEGISRAELDDKTFKTYIDRSMRF
jgi:hypothetical protein